MGWRIVAGEARQQEGASDTQLATRVKLGLPITQHGGRLGKLFMILRAGTLELEDLSSCFLGIDWSREGALLGEIRT